jgi:HEAT repeat protein
MTKTSMRMRALILSLAISLGVAPAAHAGDRVAELTAQLSAKRTEKERIAAVAALGRLGDKKALKPLVGALRDKSATVRAVAALALGKLGHRAALPALREAAGDDADELVRKRAREAVVSISEANGIEVELPADDASDDDAVEEDVTGDSKAGFGKKSKALSARPELYVLVQSGTDATTTKKVSKADKKRHGEIAKDALSSELKAVSTITGVAKDAAKYDLELLSIDVQITKLDTRTVGSQIEVKAELKLAISDADGKMLSVVSGGAAVQVKKASYNTSYLPQLRREAIENAVKGIFDDLLEHLKKGCES